MSTATLSPPPARVPPVPSPPPRPTTDPTPPQSGWRRAFFSGPRWPGVVLAAVVVLGLLTGRPRIWGLVLAGGVAVLLERRFRRHDQPHLRPGARTDVLHLLVTPVLQTICIAVPFAVTWLLLQPLAIEASAEWLAAQPVPVTFGLGFVLFTFVLYWQHRLAHTVPALWRLHAVHHSSERLDWLAAGRLHPAEFLWGGFLLAVPLVVLGFPLVQIGAFQAVTTIWAVLEHANVDWRLRWMDRLYPNVEYHHWHHSRDVEGIGVNFGMPWWDTLFGTYHMPADARPTTYGIGSGVGEPMPESYLGQLAAPFRRGTPS